MERQKSRFLLGITWAAICTAVSSTTIAEQVEVRVVRRPTPAAAGGCYSFNRAPLQPTMFMRLSAGSITPRGWLRGQLQLEADGMAGHLTEISRYLTFDENGWTKPEAKGGWEELPYWLRGYGDLGYVLKDDKIIAETNRWIEAILATQQPDGWFGPQGLRTSLKGKPDMWPHMPVLNVLQSYYEFTGDERVIHFMLTYFHWQNGLPSESFSAGYWPRMRLGDNIESICWLYNLTGQPWLLDLVRKMHANMADWTTDVPNWHNVNIAECLREPAEYWLLDHDPKFYEATVRNYEKVMRLYGQFPGGGFAGDENCRVGFGDPRQGIETCGIVEFIHSFQMLTRISGDPLWADRCEEIAINSLPASLTPDAKALHYLTGANMIQLDRNEKHPGMQNRGMLLAYSPHVYRCCQHNHAMGWPYYAEELWLATADKGLCASLYAASEVKARVADGSELKIVEETDYPFSDRVRLRISTPKPVAFPLYLRVPRWSGQPRLALNDQQLEVNAEPLSYVVVERKWNDGDVLTLQLPMRVFLRTWKANKNSVSVDYGPLTFSLKIGEKWVRSGGTDAWPEWEVFPTTPWNYGLVVDKGDPGKSFEIVHRAGALSEQPFTAEGSPIELRVWAKRLPKWRQDELGLVGLLPQGPVASDQPEETITLIPMGAARLRISSFPTIQASKP